MQLILRRCIDRGKGSTDNGVHRQERRRIVDREPVVDGTANVALAIEYQQILAGIQRIGRTVLTGITGCHRLAIRRDELPLQATVAAVAIEPEIAFLREVYVIG